MDHGSAEENGNPAAEGALSSDVTEPGGSGSSLHNLFSAKEVPRPEIVIGLVGALGTKLQVIERGLVSALSLVNYRTSTVRVSDLIAKTELAGVAFVEPKTRLDELMDLGDRLREKVGGRDGSTAAALAIFKISQDRASANSRTDDPPPDRSEHATVIRQLKHQDEVKLLRRVYGSRFVLVGVWSPLDERRHNVDQRLAELHPSQDEHWRAMHVSRLMDRDEKDARNVFGQRVRATFELSDAYVSLKTGVDVSGQLERLVKLLFGAPWETPTWEEQAMFQASAARLRSADAGRQVGAVVVDEEYELLVTGTNEVPRAGGGQYWGDDAKDHRDFRIGYDANLRLKHDLVIDVFQSLKANVGWLSREKQELPVEQLTREAVDGPLKDSRIGDILEFGRIAHAEMAAICTAARRGTPLRGGVLLTTTYPCHECARLIIAAGIARVIYVDPYPKSRVREMYRFEVSDDGSEYSDKVRFDPFVGVAPRLYPTVFSMVGRGRDPLTGDYLDWEPAQARPRLMEEAQVYFPPYVLEDAVVEQLRNDLARVGAAAYQERAE